MTSFSPFVPAEGGCAPFDNVSDVGCRENQQLGNGQYSFRSQVFQAAGKSAAKSGQRYAVPAAQEQLAAQLDQYAGYMLT